MSPYDQDVRQHAMKLEACGYKHVLTGYLLTSSLARIACECKLDGEEHFLVEVAKKIRVYMPQEFLSDRAQRNKWKRVFVAQAKTLRSRVFANEKCKHGRLYCAKQECHGIPAFVK